MTDLLFEDAGALVARMAAGDLAPSELMAAVLERIAAVNPAVNAVVSLRDPDLLMAEARALDGAGGGGPLFGLPVAIKDLADAAGLPTSQGSPLFAGEVAARDDIMVARMRAAGAVIIGKTNVPEFGMGSHTINPVFGPTRNPWDTGRSAGGSSGGAAVGLATGMLPIADGSDAMGSLRNPAGWNNVYGFRPSWDLIPGEPEGDTFLHPLSTLGPMGRSPADLARLLAVQAGPDPRQPRGRDPGPLTPLDVDLAGRRIGWLGGMGLPFEAGVLETCEAALAIFGDLGCTVEEVALPVPRGDLWDSWTTLRSWSAAGSLSALHADPATRALLKPPVVWEVERGLALSALEVHRASLIRSRWYAAAAALFDRFDALVLPTAQLWPFPVEWDWPKEIAGVAMDTYHRWMEVVIPASLIGLPALAVPAGFGAAGLPIGLQIIGRRGSDLSLLQIGQGWHATAPWIGRRPMGL